MLGFLEWRTAQVKPVSKKHVSKNTALIDTKCMSVIMREAMRRDFCEGNHCERIGIPKDPPRQKPEITDEELKQIRRELRNRPEWMRVSFEIAIHQGCRLSETAVPMDRINLSAEEIQFWAKGRDGKPHIFTTKLHPGLKPLIQDLRRLGRTATCQLPRMAAKDWHFFFKECGLPHLCFHCTRVTVITRLARAGVSISQAMAYVGHASALIHQIYQRLTAKDVGASVAALASISG